MQALTPMYETSLEVEPRLRIRSGVLKGRATRQQSSVHVLRGGRRVRAGHSALSEPERALMCDERYYVNCPYQRSTFPAGDPGELHQARLRRSDRSTWPASHQKSIL